MSERHETAVDPRALVREGYDRASLAYRGDTYDLEKSGYGHWLRRLGRQLEPQSRVLDLGCGCGIPVAAELQRRHVVTGVDLSPVQIARARRLVPEATFLCDDMASASFAPGAFDAVVAFYSIINVPVAEQPALFERIAQWLRPGGWLVAVLGRCAWTGTEPDFRGVQGVPMFWSYADAAAYRGWLTEAGFVIAEEGTQPREGWPGYSVFVAHTRDGGNN